MLGRMVLLGGMLLVGVIMVGGMALADDKAGTFGPDTLIGTDQLDRLYGLGGADVIRVKSVNDDCYGGSRADEIRCGPSTDRIDNVFVEDDLFGGSANETINHA